MNLLVLIFVTKMHITLLILNVASCFFYTWELTGSQIYEHFYFSIFHIPLGSKGM